MATNGSLPDQATTSQSAIMVLFDNNSDYDSKSEYFDARGYFDVDSEDVFYEARSTFDNEPESEQKAVSPLSNKQPVVPAAAPQSVLSRKRTYDNTTKEDKGTDSSSPTAPSLSNDVAENRAKKQKPTIVFGKSSGFGTMKAPQLSSATGSTAPTVNSFAATKPFTFVASTTDNNVLFNKGSASSPDDNNKENDTYNDGAKLSAFGEAPRETLASVKETEVVTTDEEDEETICETKGKLFVMGANNSWKDHDVGTFRLNMDNNTGDRRLVMRADAVHRLMLNQKLFAGMKVFTMQEKFIRFGALETTTNEEGETETKPVSYALKVASATEAQELCDQINIYVPKNRMRKRKVYRALEDDEQSSPQPEAGLPLSPKKQRNL